MIKFECESLERIEEPNRTFIIRNIMINTIKKLTPSIIKKLDDEMLYRLYLVVSNIIGDEPSIVGYINEVEVKKQ